jgi:hypothetical protein
MEAEFLRRFAQRMRALMLRSRTEAAREQLRLWAEEFEERAAALDREAGNNHENPCDSRNGSA